MMETLLRFWPAFRALEYEVKVSDLTIKGLELKLANLQSDQIKIEDEVRLWRARADWAETDRDKLRTELTVALKNISNWQASMTGAPHVPFPEVYTPPTPTPTPSDPTTAGRPSVRPMTMRDMQRTANLQARMAAYEARAKAVADI